MTGADIYLICPLARLHIWCAGFIYVYHRFKMKNYTAFLFFFLMFMLKQSSKHGPEWVLSQLQWSTSQLKWAFFPCNLINAHIILLTISVKFSKSVSNKWPSQPPFSSSRTHKLKVLPLPNEEIRQKISCLTFQRSSQSSERAEKRD